MLVRDLGIRTRTLTSGEGRCQWGSVLVRFSRGAYHQGVTTGRLDHAYGVGQQPSAAARKALSHSLPAPHSLGSIAPLFVLASAVPPSLVSYRQYQSSSSNSFVAK